MKFFYPKLKKIKTSDEIVNITTVQHYFSKNLQGLFFFLFLLPHPSYQLRHHSGIWNSDFFWKCLCEQGPKLAAKTNEATHKLQIFRFAVKNIPVILKHKGWRLKLGPNWEINSNNLLILRITIEIDMLIGCKLCFVPYLVQKCSV